MASKPQYSGDLSEEFWERINRIEDEKVGSAIYMLGCCLQDLEGVTLKALESAEKGQLKKKKLKKKLKKLVKKAKKGRV